MTRFATIDVGSNTVLLLVAERDEGAAGDGRGEHGGGAAFRPVVERAEITRLGRGVDRTGRLDLRSVEATLEVLSRYVAEARALGARGIACVATSAARDAEDGAQLFEAVRARTGVTPEIISGDEEARLVWASAWRDFGAPAARRGGASSSRLAVLDVGGGSTELCVGAGPAPSAHMSLQLGAVRLTERVKPPDPPGAEGLSALRAAAADALREAAGLVADASVGPAGEGRRMIAVSGTATTLAAVRKRLAVYDAAVVHGAELTFAELEELYGGLGALTTPERAALPGMEPKRADVIVAGCAIVLEAMRLAGAGRVTVSDRGVRWGLLYDRFGHA